MRLGVHGSRARSATNPCLERIRFVCVLKAFLHWILLFVVFFLTAASTEKERKQFVSRAGDVIAHASHPTTPHASPSRGHDESCVHEGDCIRG